VAVRLAPVGMCAALRRCDNEGAILDGARTQQNVPVRSSSRHGEGRRDGEGEHTLFRQQPVELGKAQVVADRKSDRSELAVELATEAGADAFLAWQAERCVARWDSAARVDKGLRRWRAVARAAARQSRRPFIPDVDGVVSTPELAARVGGRVHAGGMVLMLHESATEPIAGLPLAQADSLTLLVGPEGGIAEDEIATLTAAGARAVRLGPTVLRTSTAAAVALGALGVLTSRWC